MHTFEFNEKRAQLAQAEFVANDLGSRVTCRHGDVCAEDFSYATAAGLTHESVDGAIFDLPQPWDAIRLAAPFIKPGGRLCVFSPCIEQVARALDALREGGFTGSEVIEAIVRTHEVRPAPPGVSALEAAVAQAEVSKRAREEAAAAEAAADAGTASSEAAAASDADVQNGTGEVAAEPDEAAAPLTRTVCRPRSERVLTTVLPPPSAPQVVTTKGVERTVPRYGAHEAIG